MRKINLEEYDRANRAAFTRQRLCREPGKSPLRRERDAEELAVLLKLDAARWERCLKDGTLEKTAPRKYRLKLFP